MKYCKICGEIIPEGRVKALPNVETCVEHSEAKKKLGFGVITSKTTYSELDIVDEKQYKNLKSLDRKRITQPQ
jgi:transcription initiation factor TFIIIB Brf1 subunit/transcription initiation factor TFIIB